MCKQQSVRCRNDDTVHLFSSASALWISVCSQISFQVFLNSMSNSILRKHSSDKNIQDLFQALKASIPTSTEIPQWAGKCAQYDIMKGTRRGGREAESQSRPCLSPPPKLSHQTVCLRCLPENIHFGKLWCMTATWSSCEVLEIKSASQLPAAASFQLSLFIVDTTMAGRVEVG